MRLFERDSEYPEDIDILCFSIGKFDFKWFTDNGEWFIYIRIENDKKVWGYRFSSAGNMKIDYTKKILLHRVK